MTAVLDAIWVLEVDLLNAAGTAAGAQLYRCRVQESLDVLERSDLTQVHCAVKAIHFTLPLGLAYLLHCSSEYC